MYLHFASYNSILVVLVGSICMLWPCTSLLYCGHFNKGTTIREHNVIYAMIDDLKEEIGQKMPTVEKEHKIGQGVVAKEFVYHEKKQEIAVAGCRVNKGIFDSTKLFRVTRGKDILGEGPLESLKHHKVEVTEIPNGKDCGLRMQDTSIRFKAGDIITCYENRQEQLPVTWSPGF